MTAESSKFENLKLGEEYTYIIRLKNGDMISGHITEETENESQGKGIILSTELGLATIFENQISEIELHTDLYKHSHRIFLMPSAEPISSDHFVGLFELALLYGGVGITDYLSITAGRSLLPDTRSQDQFTLFNVKISSPKIDLDSLYGYLTFAVGMNWATLNDANKFVHYYAVGTFTGHKSKISGGIYYKAGNDYFYPIRLYDRIYRLEYEDGAFGINLGLDTKFSTRHDLHFIAELWNNDIMKPTNTAVLLGFRMANSTFSSDFGITFFTQPFVVPFVSFTWTPF